MVTASVVMVLDKLDLDKSMGDKEFSKKMDLLKPRLGAMQRKARETGRPVMVVFEGWDSTCMSRIVNDYIRCLDPRGFELHPIYEPTEEELDHPFMWRFLVRTPERGRMAIFDQSWYSRTLEERLRGKDNAVPLRSLEEISAFERQMAADGCTIIKFFLHMSRKEHRKREDKAHKGGVKRCVLAREALDHHREYETFLPIVEGMLERTSRPFAPWTVVEAEDDNFALCKVIEHSINVLEKVTADNSIEPTALAPKADRYPAKPLSLKDIDLSVSEDPDEYRDKLKKYQEKVAELQCRLATKKIPMIIALEGWDAAGKGGDILRLTDNLDPRGYRVVPIAAPNDIELAHHYLWRFHTQFPRNGHIAIFDRTWYGRVLVERVEGYSKPEVWGRAYTEINEMEEMLADSGAALVKIWLQIDKETQLKRFNERGTDEDKMWKITPDDWRNREKWDQYELAVEEMLMRTSTKKAPWTVVESNDKYYSRIKFLKTVIEAAERRLD
jgi:AMP-polyphosphate phosphotransferase